VKVARYRMNNAHGYLHQDLNDAVPGHCDSPVLYAIVDDEQLCFCVYVENDWNLFFLKKKTIIVKLANLNFEGMVEKYQRDEDKRGACDQAFDQDGVDWGLW
jgi:hypothetical protein